MNMLELTKEQIIINLEKYKKYLLNNNLISDAGELSPEDIYVFLLDKNL